MNDKNLKKYLFSAVAGVLSALMFTAIQFGGIAGIIGIYFSAVPIAMAGLIFGLLYACTASFVGVVLMLVLGLEVAFSFALIDCIPVLLAVGLFLFGFEGSQNNKNDKQKTFDSGFILASICLLKSFTMFVFAKILAANFAASLAGSENVLESEVSVKSILYVFVESMIKEAAPDLPLESSVFANILIPFTPAIMMIMWLFHILIALVFSAWIVEKLGKSIRNKPNYKNMILPYWFITIMFIVFLSSFVLGGDNQYIARNISLILFIPFVFQGFSVVHVFADKTKYPKTALFLFYSFFVVGSYWVILAIGTLGLVENFIKLRHKVAVKNLEE